MTPPLRLRLVIRLQTAQALTGLACRLPIGLLIPQTTDEATHFLLAITDGGFKPLTTLLLVEGRLLPLLLPATQQFLMEKLGAGQQGRRILRCRLLTLTLLLKPADHGIHITFGLRAEQAAGLIDHPRIKAKASRNRQGIAAARNPPEELIGGRQRFTVKGDGCVFEAAVAVLERFQFSEVGGGNGQPGPFGKRAQQSRRQCCAFTGIGSRTHLIKQNQRRDWPLGQSIEDLADPFHMTTERGQALLQRLLVTDIRKHLGTPGQGRRPRAGKPEPGTGHQGGEPDALEGHRLATGVRAGDRHHPQMVGNGHADGNHAGPLLLFLLPDQQGMTKLIKVEGRIGLGLQLGRNATQPLSITGAGQAEVELQQHISESLQGLMLIPHSRTELGQHTLFLRTDAALLGGQAIAEIDHHLRLHEDRVPRG